MASGIGQSDLTLLEDAVEVLEKMGEHHPAKVLSGVVERELDRWHKN